MCEQLVPNERIRKVLFAFTWRKSFPSGTCVVADHITMFCQSPCTILCLPIPGCAAVSSLYSGVFLWDPGTSLETPLALITMSGPGGAGPAHLEDVSRLPSLTSVLVSVSL